MAMWEGGYKVQSLQIAGPAAAFYLTAADFAIRVWVCKNFTNFFDLIKVSLKLYKNEAEEFLKATES